MSRITKTQRAMLAFLEACGGRGMIYSGYRTWACNVEREVANCNAVSIYFAELHGWIEAVASNRPGRWFAITEKGAAVLKAGKW